MVPALKPRLLTACILCLLIQQGWSQPSVEELDRRIIDAADADERERKSAERDKNSVSLFDILRATGKNLNIIESNNAIQKFQELYDAGKYEDALPYANKLVRLNPTVGAVYEYRGVLLNRLEKYEEALTDFDKAIAMRFTMAECYRERGIAKRSLLRNKEAIADLTVALAKYPAELAATADKTGFNYGIATTYNERGLAYYDIGAYDEAIRDYNQAIETNPDQKPTYAYSRGKCLAKLHRYYEAIEDFQTYLKKDPNDALSFNQLGIVQLELKDYSSALQSFQKCLRIDSKIVDPYYYGITCTKMRLVDEARSNLSKISKTSEPAKYYNLYADILLTEKKYTEALAACNASLERGEGTGCLNRRGYLNFLMGKSTEAVADYDKARFLGGIGYIPQYEYREKALLASKSKTR